MNSTMSKVSVTAAKIAIQDQGYFEAHNIIIRIDTFIRELRQQGCSVAVKYEMHAAEMMYVTN